MQLEVMPQDKQNDSRKIGLTFCKDVSKRTIPQDMCSVFTKELENVLQSERPHHTET